MTHAFSVVIFTQGPKLCQDTPSQRISYKTLFQRIRLRQETNTEDSSAAAFKGQVGDYLKTQMQIKARKRKDKKKKNKKQNFLLCLENPKVQLPFTKKLLPLLHEQLQQYQLPPLQYYPKPRDIY